MPYFRKIPTVLLSGIVLLAAGCHPWFKSTLPWEEKPDPDQPPVLVNSSGETYLPGTPSWVALIDDCMSYGGTRGECIDALPPEELSKLKAMEGERGAMRRQQMNMGYALNEGGGYQNFGFARIKLPSGWLVDFDQSRNSGQGKVISVRNPDGTDLLQVQSLVAPDTVKQEVLRNMTNVDSSVSLSFESWGDYSGFQYDYTESGLFFRQWWIANDRNLIFITYQSLAPLSDADIEQLAEIVRSLRINPPGNAGD